MQHFVAVYWRAFEILRFFMSAKLNRAPRPLSLPDRRYLISPPPVLPERGPNLSCPDQSPADAPSHLVCCHKPGDRRRVVAPQPGSSWPLHTTLESCPGARLVRRDSSERGFVRHSG